MKSFFQKNQITGDSLSVAIETQITLMIHHFFNEIITRYVTIVVGIQLSGKANHPLVKKQYGREERSFC